MAKTSPAKYAANFRYQAKEYELVSFRARRHERLNDRINRAAEVAGKSRAQYMHDAICAQLEKDGITDDEA